MLPLDAALAAVAVKVTVNAPEMFAGTVSWNCAPPVSFAPSSSETLAGSMAWPTSLVSDKAKVSDAP
jgi:hypothetical protein